MKKIKVKLSVYFAIITTITIALTSALFAIYLTLNVNNLLGKYQDAIEKMSNSLSLTLTQVLLDDVSENNFTSSKLQLSGFRCHGFVAPV